MKFTFLALSALLAIAAADTTTAEASVVTSTPETECAKQCDPRDICCTAKCYKVPCPSDNQADDTNSCVSACPQGTGTPADIQKYADCEQSCYSSHFWGGHGATATQPTTSSTSTGTSGTTATSTGSSSSSTDSSDSNTSNNDSDSSDSSDGTSTSSSTFSQQTENAGAHMKLGASAASLFGLVAAAFAL
ncbi:hypothetical protein N7541_011843 [Penicillium brevicompactum]|uniref:Uncharacterized protein n=1 Tax=Penicillium brevicompactum TaxID=5074 RepID=A0A9W9UIK3_PENBR|nr:uncharacterized protein N7506_008449 [Penicillium brevicompactum]KAJ5325347.1 hypothetical protein N7506_008449 [Penicillium brevicompactum]KAJ5339891.1 hypothetical protein N7452_006619 [Penicillium brevicompactum]KAJ5342719.1 hypothetical protein N7541_011843 [Penicillium brevicompactum]